MQTMLRNLQYALRQLRKSPVFSITAALTLALGIGANTAIFTVVYATLLAPMPYPQPDQLVMVWSKIQGDRNSIAAQDFVDWKNQNTAFQDLNAFSGGSFNLATKDQPEYVEGQTTTPGMYRMMGSPFQYGRDFLPEEGKAGREHVVILMNKLWKRLGSDPNIIGKSLQIDGTPYTVVGVMAPGQSDRLDQSLIVPLVFKPDQLNHDFHWLLAMGRLKPGMTIKQAQADMDSVTANIAKAFPKSNKGWGAIVEPLKNDFMPKERIQTLKLLLGAVGFVLLIACANVANLLLAKGTSRQKEIAIRISLGAARKIIFTQFLTENLLLALVGGLLGVAVGAASLRWLIASMPPGTLPSEADLTLNLPILLFTFAASTLAGLLFGCAPAWYATRVDPGDALKEGGRSGTGAGRHRLRKVLVVGEFALALALLTGAGLAIHSFWNLTQVDLGVHTEHVQTFFLPVPDARPKDPAQITGYYQQMLASLKAVPGVLDVSASVGLPLRGPGFGMPFIIAGQPEFADPSQRPGAAFGMITPDYFKTYGIQVVRGRSFDEHDTAANVKVAVVNEEFVQKYLKGKDPLQQRINVEELIPGVTKLGPYITWQIVGVFHNVRAGGFRQDFPEIDIPFWQIPWPSANIGVRTSVDPATMSKSIAAAVHAVDPQIALAEPRTLDDVKSLMLGDDRFTMTLYLAFAVVALLLAAIGIYGVMAFTVAQREHEIGLRMALGASRGNVVNLVLKEALVLALVGLGLGLVGAYFVGRAMQSTLYGVGSLDFTAVGAVALVLLSASLLASWIPARRAAGVPPMRALRTE
ncbi:MAG TPA: ABC transporter permease [Terracidiphilus sp.]|jgi:putative ABC transport system permease protein|nr:ABC transporter permease [Terracidiphilus sp.]